MRSIHNYYSNKYYKNLYTTLQNIFTHKKFIYKVTRTCTKYLLNAALNYLTFLQQVTVSAAVQMLLSFLTALLLLPSRHHKYQLLPCEYQYVT